MNVLDFWHYFQERTRGGEIYRSSLCSVSARRTVENYVGHDYYVTVTSCTLPFKLIYFPLSSALLALLPVKSLEFTGRLSIPTK